MKRPPQVSNLLWVIRDCIEQRKYTHTTHALKRVDTRKVSLPDVIYVLKNGYHEKRKTSFDEAFQNWKYSIRGKTLSKSGMLIITVINLSINEDL